MRSPREGIKMMEITFSMKLKKDGKTLQLLMLCTECRQELEMAQDGSGFRFRCGKHGELGRLSPKQFADGLNQAQEKAARQYGLGKPVGMRMGTAGPSVQ